MRVRRYGDPDIVKKIARMESKVCSIPECGNKAHAKGLCASHHSRMVRHGDPLAGNTPRVRHGGASCSIDGCASAAKSKGFCGLHYQRYWKYADPNECRNAIGLRPRFCVVEGCSNKHHANGYCSLHSARVAHNGKPGRAERIKAPRGAFQKWLENNSDHTGEECLIAPFGKRDSGYSMLRVDGVNIGAHRFMCILANGVPLRPELEAAHSCGNGDRGCVNPRHLRWATSSENQDDKWLHGTMIHGSKQYHAKLEDEDVLRIRKMRGTMTQVGIAKIFGITQPTVSSVQLKKSWSWL